MRRTAVALALACATTLSLASTALADEPTDPPRPPGRGTLLDQENARISGVARGLGAERAEAWAVKDVVADRDGTRHVRVDRTFQGLPVVGGDQVVHYDARGGVRSVDRAGSRDVSPDTLTPRLTGAAATRNAADSTGRKATPAAPRLVVDAVGLQPRLAYQVTLSPTGVPYGEDVTYTLVDAETGRVLRSSSTSYVAGIGAPGGTRNVTTPAQYPPQDATAVTFYAGSQPIVTAKWPDTSYSLADPTRGGSEVLAGPSIWPADANDLVRQGNPVRNASTVWGNGSPGDTGTKAAETLYGVSTAWDYFRDKHQRVGVADDGRGIPTVMMRDPNGGANAAYSSECDCMIVIDGSSSARSLNEREVVAHEFTHGVVAHTARLGAVSEGSGINEHMADVFGTMASFHRDTAADPAGYVLGDKFRPGGIRRMDNPVDSDGVPAGCWGLKTGGLEVHDGAGVGNLAFYLIAEGSGPKTVNGRSYNGNTCDGTTIAGIGRDEAAQIWYRALKVSLTSTSDYHDLREATIAAAKSLFGDGSTQAATVAAAWSGVSVEPWPTAATPDECVGSTSDPLSAGRPADTLSDDLGPMGGATSDGISVARNADGRLDAFALSAKDRTLWHRWQLSPNGAWSAWTKAGPAMACRIAVGYNADGRIELFGIREGSREIWHSWQGSRNGPFSPWYKFSGPAVDVTVGRNSDGRMEIFARNPGTKEVFNTYQVAPSAGWAAWSHFSGPAASVAIGTNVDGRMEVYARNPVTLEIWNRYQVRPSAPWSGWSRFSGPALDVTVGTDHQGRQQLFARGPNNKHLYHVAQNGPNGAWGGWEDYSGAYVGSVRVGLAPWGLSVYVTDERGGSWELYQTNGVWQSWLNNSGPVTVAPTPAREADGSATQFAVTADGRTYLRTSGADLLWDQWRDFTV